MRRCQHTCGCEGNAVGRDPDTGLRLCAGCLGRSILGTDCSLARRYFVHVPAHFGAGVWTEPPPLRDGDRTAVPAEFEAFLTIRTGYAPPAWDFMPLAEASTPVEPFARAVSGLAGGAVGGAAVAAGGVGTGFGCVRAGTTTVTNPHRPPKDPPPGPLPPPPGRPVQPNPPRR
ncbi:MAG: hypothetical protein HOV87_29875 [Catenulispora sp.]|nr:hypothetical protein [Catenulispora sp.]